MRSAKMAKNTPIDLDWSNGILSAKNGRHFTRILISDHYFWHILLGRPLINLPWTMEVLSNNDLVQTRGIRCHGIPHFRTHKKNTYRMMKQQQFLLYSNAEIRQKCLQCTYIRAWLMAHTDCLKPPNKIMFTAILSCFPIILGFGST